MDKRIRPFDDIAPLNVSMNMMILTLDFDLNDDFATSFLLRQKWQDPRMMFPDIEGEPTLNNKTVLTMDLRFLEELWVPDIFYPNEKSIKQEGHRLRIDSAGFIYYEERTHG